MSKPAIAFIGLGNMGGPMAANLVSAGYTVHGFDVTDIAREKAAEAGVTLHDSAADAAKDAQIVVTMLPNGRLVRNVLEECATGEGKLYVDSSTIGVGEAKENAEFLNSTGSRYIDAPVSGGVAGAAAGTLAFMVGGADADLAEAKDILDVMGRSTTHCGPVGAGAAAKLCNNMILGVQQIAIAEGLVLGQRLGLDPQAFFDVVSNSTGSCWALTTNCPAPGVLGKAPSDNNFEPGFATNLIVKDLGLAMSEVEATGTEARLGELASEIYSKLADDGLGAKDFSVVYEQLRERKA
ncbi:3-hydroxyisobutyrate dehydrogenase [Corynebacterium aquilae]|uniref:3-hydroxyisobutyrate dehydrogenase n=1 Tax=Corynebacterium aquilae DSM 44791 TaxID=1431546 RepID=A0A1L7CHS8_9CORY|nr:3-hydroxyisobutyrate dehydrogenase [Corynebacterium aquilae]APT85416.1 3-hydroxyisobutyrate dehydrogenase [Corynebacterium aquilae DSM 44791]